MDTALLENSEYLNFNDIPDWYKDNKYILTRYRNTNRGYKYYFYSIFKLHNETFNIWTHLMGALLFISIGIYSNFHFDLKKYWSQYLCINLYIFSIFVTFLFSSIMHIFYPQNCHICKKLQKLDYIGINLQIFSSMATFIYFAFYCEKYTQIIYYVLILTIGLINTTITTIDTLTSSRYRWVRLTSFLSCLILFLIPIIHRSLLDNKNIIEKHTFSEELIYFTISTFVFLIAFLVFVFRIPEKFNPGKYDICFHSHQIFHTLAVIGSFILFKGFINVMEKDNSIICQLRLK
tara:strand:+ start:253 stop:1125 length:873 start_codon:yes stop_codon:yes gene_type:complete